MKYIYTVNRGKEAWPFRIETYRRQLRMLVKRLDEMIVIELGQICEDECLDVYD